MQNQIQISESLSEIELGYIAGILDGEGSIHICRSHGYFLPRVGISNTYKPLIAWLKRKIGCDYIHVFKYGYNTHKRPCYYLSFENRQKITALLKTLLPYLIVKRRHAEIMLEYLSLRQQNLSKGQNRVYTEQELALYFKLKKLNRRGNKIKRLR